MSISMKSKTLLSLCLSSLLGASASYAATPQTTESPPIPLAAPTIKSSGNNASAATTRSEREAFLALQPLMQVSQTKLADGTTLELLNLNPSVGRWLILKEKSPNGSMREAHIDTGQEVTRFMSLTANGLRIQLASDIQSNTQPNSSTAQGSAHQPSQGLLSNLLKNTSIKSTTVKANKGIECPLGTAAERQQVFALTSEPYRLACNGSFFVRGRAKGYKSSLESVTDWLRAQGSFGESIINWQKDLFPTRGDSGQASAGAVKGVANGPEAAGLSSSAPKSLSSGNLGLSTTLKGSALPTGGWAPVQGASGVWVSMAAPSYVTPLPTQASSSTSLVYLLAMDLNQMDLRYAVGVEHPSLGWSGRAPQPHPGPGPDGYSSISPLQRSGVVPPWAMNHLAVVFTGGFKREHSAFKAGPKSLVNHGTHYGFVEAGVVLSPLQVGISTLSQRQGEAPRLNTWTAEDQKQGVSGLLFARQNGYPLVENGKEGSQLAVTFGSNWSGNHEGNAATMRSAVCVTQHDGHRYAIYAVFSKAVPRDMAQVMKAYHCEDSMQLDMNAPALVYAAVVVPNDKGVLVHKPLLSSMLEQNAPEARFASSADTRDFFYLARH